MKKLTLLIVALFVFGLSGAFAQEDASPLALTGSITFELGDDDLGADTPGLPEFSDTKKATAKLTVASPDEKVTASVSVDLLAAPSVETTVEFPEDEDYYYSTLTGGTFVFATAWEYQVWKGLSDLVAFWNDVEDDTTAVDGVTIWDPQTVNNLRNELYDTGVASTAELDVLEELDGDDIVLKSPVKPGATPEDGEEFKWTVTNAGYVATIETNFDTTLQAELVAALNKILDESTTTTTGTDVSEINPTAVGDVTSFVNGLTVDQIKDLSDNDKALLKQAVDLEIAFGEVGALDISELDVETTVTYTPITAATLSFNQVGGVVDITALIGGQHVTAGALKADASGHQEDSVKAYSGLKVALSSGVVEGLSASAGLYIDGNDAQDAVDVTDDWYTWLDEDALESEAAADPIYGATVGLGYSMTMMDMTFGATTAVGLYDLMGDMAYAISVQPSFSGMGAKVGVQFDYGLDIMYLMANASYTVMGITPAVKFYYVDNAGDYVLAYASTESSVLGKTKNSGGMAVDGSLKVDLAAFLPEGMGATISGGAIYGIDDGDLGWNAGVSVTPMSGLTLSFNGSADAVEESTFDWMTKLAYTYSTATVYFQFADDYDTDDGENVQSYALGTTISF
jgi:hypothetical protein